MGGAIGAGTGVLIGKKMDEQKAELEKTEGAQVNTVTDANKLQTIIVTIVNGILLAKGKAPSVRVQNRN